MAGEKGYVSFGPLAYRMDSTVRMRDRRERKRKGRRFDAVGCVLYTEDSSCRENSRLSRLFRKSVWVWVIGVK